MKIIINKINMRMGLEQILGNSIAINSVMEEMSNSIEGIECSKETGDPRQVMAIPNLWSQ